LPEVIQKLAKRGLRGEKGGSWGNVPICGDLSEEKSSIAGSNLPGRGRGKSVKDHLADICDEIG